MKKLGGTIFIRNAIQQDYHIEESVQCLKDLCDEVIICDAGSDDGTDKLVEGLQDKKTRVILCPKEMWEEQKSQSKLAYFTNVAINALNSEWNINLQSDEIIGEDCFPAIWEAIDKDNEGYFCHRVNLWGNSQYFLHVPESRLPVGESIIRLAKTKYQSIVDAQSLDAPASYEYIHKIKIYHTGFIRDKTKHMVKIENMMCNIFGWGMDEKLKSMGKEFDPWVHFSKEDIHPIQEPLPKYITKWAKERDEMNGIII